MTKDEYIKRSDVLELTVYQSMMGLNMAQTKLREIPGEDVRPVVHGHWIIKPNGTYGQLRSFCSACGKHSGIGGIVSNQKKPYCPNCGAVMDEKEEEE